MAILVDETKRVIVQGITGREGMARTRLMLDYGTRVVAGVTPGKAGAVVLQSPRPLADAPRGSDVTLEVVAGGPKVAVNSRTGCPH